MSAMPEGVQVLFDQAFEQESVSDESSEPQTDAPRDYHKEQFQAYAPPHKRGHNVQSGDQTINFKNRKPGAGDDPDKIQGTDNDKYQRLKLRVNFAITKEVLDVLRPQFPGIYFHAADNGNHDHPVSHVVTQIGTRLLQRRIRPGARILDVYGNPNACDRFNASQSEAEQPKNAKALVWRFGSEDFIREANKWGPFFDQENGERYHRSTLRNFIDSGEIENYDTLQMIHTLYYEDMQNVCDALHAPGKKRRILALIHRHMDASGSINNGEQTYVTNAHGLVKQTNVLTRSSYVHNNVTPFFFAEKKEWYPRGKMGFRGEPEELSSRGFAWELNIVNKDTWIVEIVPIERSLDTHEHDAVDFSELWDQQAELDFDGSTRSSDSVKIEDDSMMLPTPDGKIVVLQLSCKPLLASLRASCIGKPRDGKLLAELVHQARHLVNPSTLFGAKVGMACPEGLIYDHVLGAMLVDAEREGKLLGAVDKLRPVLLAHARASRMGPSIKDYSFRDLIGLARGSVKAGRQINKVVKASDVIDSGLGTLDGFLGDI